MTETLTLEEGLQETIHRLEPVSERPLFVSVYGIPNSGKSFLINKLGEYFEEKELFVWKFSFKFSHYCSPN